MYDLPTGALVACLLAVMFIANELGYRLGTRQRAQTEREQAVGNALKASAFALVAFLLGISFSITSQRHEVRRRLVLDEANAVGTLYLRAELVEEAFGGPMQELLRQYVDARLKYFAEALDPARRDVAEQHMKQLLDDIWSQVAGAVARDEQTARTSQIVPAANAVIDLFTTRAWAVRSHLPTPVVALLIISVTVSSMLAGHSSGQAGARHLGLWASLNVLFALVLFVVLDFDRPRRGFVRVDHSMLVEQRASMQEK